MCYHGLLSIYHFVSFQTELVMSHKLCVIEILILGRLDLNLSVVFLANTKTPKVVVKRIIRCVIHIFSREFVSHERVLHSPFGVLDVYFT